MKREKVLRTILSVTLAAFLLCGCGNSTDETTTSEDVPEVVEPVEAPDTEEKEEVTKPAEEEETKQEEVTEEPTDETSNEMPEAQVTTTVADITEFAQYMANVDPTTPHIVIWNETEGYVIDMGEGEHYYLKSDDRIFLNTSANMSSGSDSIPEIKDISTSGSYEVIPDYTKFDKPQKAIYKIWTDDDPNGEGIKITCYLDAPAE